MMFVFSIAPYEQLILRSLGMRKVKASLEVKSSGLRKHHSIAFLIW